jgi:hypothetical protein
MLLKRSLGKSESLKFNDLPLLSFRLKIFEAGCCCEMPPADKIVLSEGNMGGGENESYERYLHSTEEEERSRSKMSAQHGHLWSDQTGPQPWLVAKAG